MGLFEKLEKIQAKDIPSSVIETELDEIYDLVLRLQIVPISEIASQLDIPVRRVEEWAKMFDRQRLLQLQYPLVGEPVLSNIIVEKKNANKEEGKARNLIIFAGVVGAVLITLIVLLQQEVIKLG